MIGTPHANCPGIVFTLAGQGRWRVAPDITEAEETEANRRAPAAILRCDRCHARTVVEAPNVHRQPTPPDLSVFDVAPSQK